MPNFGLWYCGVRFAIRGSQKDLSGAHCDMKGFFISLSQSWFSNHVSDGDPEMERRRFFFVRKGQEAEILLDESVFDGSVNDVARKIGLPPEMLLKVRLPILSRLFG